MDLSVETDSSIETDLMLLKWEVEEIRENSVFFDLRKSEGYSRVNTSNGHFFVSIQNVKPHLDGFKVTFKVGNPSMVIFCDPEISLEWSRSWSSKSGESYQAWRQSIQKKEIKVLKKLVPGVWNKIEVNITPATLEQLERVKFSMKTDVVEFSTQ